MNQIVWHGFPYLSRGPAGAGPQSAWPGMTYGGNTSYSEAWGDKGGPNWADYRSVNDHLARMQLVLRQGKPRFDLAVYWQDFGMNGTGTTGSGSNKLIQSSSALASAGYTYEYLSPALLQREDATFARGTLFGDRSAYRAVLLNDQKTMPVSAAEKLLRLARQGLPVVIVGDVPSTVPGNGDAARQDARLKSVVSQLLRQRGVVRVASEADAPGALRRLTVTPGRDAARRIGCAPRRAPPGGLHRLLLPVQPDEHDDRAEGHPHRPRRPLPAGHLDRQDHPDHGLHVRPRHRHRPRPAGRERRHGHRGHAAPRRHLHRPPARPPAGRAGDGRRPAAGEARRVVAVGRRLGSRGLRQAR
ncbi:hypothetical protein LUX33_09360 [Actinomadura madurae]|uniref:glycosyl hydrolase n=1 Tax=Actinomadura madurae TaxID=1993 RepID=UPI0020D2231D|nr:glycosyl hydrolase [Actinomadura madurae]MCP9948600.1 hypothetical protein [Actinomadura madurae]